MITIGLALAAFVLSDLFNPRKSVFLQKDDIIAKVNGTKIPATVYFDAQKDMEANYQSNGQQIDDNTRNMIAVQSWDQMVREVLLQQEYEKLGLGVKISEHNIIGVTPEELKDMIVGNNVDPQVQQIFRNPNTGMYDKAMALNFLQNMGKDPERKAIWLNIEKQLIQGKMASKYATLISQGMYTTSVEAKMLAADKNHKSDIKYIGFQYFSLPDSSFKPSQDELESYLSKHKEEYKQETTRDIDYVAFAIRPSGEDIVNTQKYVDKLAEDFKKSDNDEEFVNSSSTVPFDSKFYKKGELPKQLDSFAFSGSRGDITASFFDGEYVKMAKISKVEMLPDSVKARHILVKQGDARKTVDSLKKVIEGGADFGAIAMQYSEDPGSKNKGGDLGWFKQGMMVRPFNDSCFFGKAKKLYIVESQFGIHLIEVLEKSKEAKMVQLAIISNKIEASTATRNMIYSQANKFAGENSTAELFAKAFENNTTIDKRVATDLKPADRSIAGLESARQIVRWVYESEKGQVSNVFDCNNIFVIACVKAVREKGYASVESVKGSLEAAVIKEKKAKKFIGDIEKAGTFASLEELSGKISGAPVMEATGLTFSSTAVANIGMEPKIAGVASVLQAGKISKPIEGNNGVYVIMVTRNDDTPVSDPKMEQEQNMRMMKSRTGYFSVMNLKDEADIVDHRLNFE